MRMSTWRRCGFVLVAVGSLAAAAAGAQEKAAPKIDAAKGQQIASQVCAACHAADGNSTIPGNPKLAQQHSAYLIKQLTDYTVRAGDTLSAIAQRQCRVTAPCGTSGLIATGVRAPERSFSPT